MLGIPKLSATASSSSIVFLAYNSLCLITARSLITGSVPEIGEKSIFMRARLGEMKPLWRLWAINKQNHWLFKLAVAFLMMGLAFRLFFYKSTSFDPNLETPFIDRSEKLPQPPATADILVTPGSGADLAETEDEPSQPGECDLFAGDWIPNSSGPRYTNASCPLIEGHQNCMRNGRPDTGFLYWKWSPRDCELPSFDAKKFLETMRHKHWALIGDSISRNHVQSLLCMLSTVEQGIEVYHDAEYKSKRWHFPSYNFTVSNIWSPFLVEAAIFEDDNGVSTSEVQLKLDKLDKTWTDLYPSLDYMIISTGKWFLKAAVYHENDTIVGCHMCPPGQNLTETGFVFAYERALRSAMNFVATSNHKGLIFFRTSTPDHFENGEWHNGGICPSTAPAKEGEVELKDLNNILRKVELAEFEKASTKAAENGMNLKLLDFTNLLLARPDGHPGPYRSFQPFAGLGASTNASMVQNDCLHWCLPGPIDNWNDVIMEMAINR